MLASNIREKKYKISYKNNTFNISTPTWKDKFELLIRSNSVSDIQGNLD